MRFRVGLNVRSRVRLRVRVRYGVRFELRNGFTVVFELLNLPKFY